MADKVGSLRLQSMGMREYWNIGMLNEPDKPLSGCPRLRHPGLRK